MALEPIGDIANPTLTDNTVLVKTWETATEWDAAVSEAGVVHEDTGDLPGAGVVTLGWPSFDRGGSALTEYWTFDENSGDLIGHVGGVNGTPNGATQAAGTGPWGRDVYDFDGGGDYVILDTYIRNSGTWTWIGWARPDSFTDIDHITGVGSKQNGEWAPFSHFGTGYNGNSRFTYWTSTGFWRENNTALSTGTWYLIALTYNDGGTTTWYLDGSADGTDSIAQSNGEDEMDFNQFGRRGHQSDRYWNGRLGPVKVYNRELTSTEVQAHFDAATSGTLTTATKSYASPVQPDLESLDYALNGESVTLDVIGSPGTASEEIVSQTLDGSTAYTLTWSNSHTDFRVKLNLSTSSVTATPPTINRVGLAG